MNHRPKVKYEVDPHNKLITGISKFRHVIDGRFEIGKGNTLVYHIKAPSDDIARQAELPHQLKLRGNWSLTKDHDLRFTLDKWRRQTFGDEITLKGEIIKVDAHSLSFAVTQRTKENATSTYILKLEGSWQADKNNRLTFRVNKEKGKSDLLTFDGIWELNRRHKIIYHYEKLLTGRKESRKHSLAFDGFWNITKRGVLTYQLDLKGKSAFDFRIGKGIAEGNRIKFEIGMGLSQNSVKKDVIFYGKWIIKERTGLIFEITNPGGRTSVMKFEAEARLLGTSGIRFTLRNETGKDLGMTLTLSKTMLKGRGESFIRFLSSRKEKAVYVGTGFMW